MSSPVKRTGSIIGAAVSKQVQIGFASRQHALSLLQFVLMGQVRSGHWIPHTHTDSICYLRTESDLYSRTVQVGHGNNDAGIDRFLFPYQTASR